jgi:hypothetical protein
MTIIAKESIKVGDNVARMMLEYIDGEFVVNISNRGQISKIFEKFEENFGEMKKKYFFTGSKRERYFNDLFGYSECVQLVAEDSISQYLDPRVWSDDAKERAKAKAIEAEIDNITYRL